MIQPWHDTGLLVVGLGLVMFLIDAVATLATQQPGDRRRTHFWIRLGFAVLTMPALGLVLVALGHSGALSEQVLIPLAYGLGMLCIPALILVPSILVETPPRPSDGENGGGGDMPSPPPAPRDKPGGDLPLPSSEPGPWRSRDHTTVASSPSTTRRRGAPAPGRTPVTTPTPTRPRG